MSRTLAAFAAGAWLAGAAALFLVPHGDDPPADADAIVVLAGNEERLPAARELHRRGVAPVLAISFSDELEDAEREEACAEGAAGPEPSVFCFRAAPFSTKGEARATARLARERDWERVVVVTSGYHVFRARRLFERCLDRELSVVGTDAVWWEDGIALVTESVKLALAETLRRGC